MKPILLGISSSFFFAFTFVLNRIMSVGGGSWVWSSSLRYLFMLPFLILLLSVRRKLRPLFAELISHPWQWLLWSIVGFGVFYVPLTISAAYSPAWLVAGTWQFTIIAGSLLVPFFYETVDSATGPVKVRQSIPVRGLALSSIILIGIILMEWDQAGRVSIHDLLFGVVPVLVASFAYPLGNRKMMTLCEGRLDAYQRTLGMTIASLPLWVGLVVYGFTNVGLPSAGQVSQSAIVAIFSGIIATVLFFTATDMAKGNAQQLATVEATQSGEVVFTVFGQWLLLSEGVPSGIAFIGMALVVIGMVLHSLFAHGKRSAEHKKNISDAIHVTKS